MLIIFMIAGCIKNEVVSYADYVKMKEIKDNQIVKRDNLVKQIIDDYNVTIPRCEFEENKYTKRYCVADNNLFFYCEPTYDSKENPELQTGLVCETIF